MFDSPNLCKNVNSHSWSIDYQGVAVSKQSFQPFGIYICPLDAGKWVFFHLQSNLQLSSSHRMRESRSAFCQQTHCASLSAVPERRRMWGESPSEALWFTLWEKLASPSAYWSLLKRVRGLFSLWQGVQLHMWILNSDAAQVDKLTVQWRCNHKTLLLSPDSSEIVELLVVYGEIRVSA